MACPGQTGGPCTKRDVQVTDVDLGHGARVHMVQDTFSPRTFLKTPFTANLL